MNRDKLKFIVLFFALGLIAINIPFTKLLGADVKFTLFDFFGPIAGAFLSPALGVVTVLAVQLTNWGITQPEITTGVVIRLFPTLFATYYFATMIANKKAKKVTNSAEQKAILAVPLLAIIIFNLHPEGRAAWYFSLFWTIPLMASFFRANTFARALGATFTAHSVGGAAWVWAFNLPASVWQGLIPIVISERVLFAGGIAVSYFAVRHALAFLAAHKLLPSLDKINPRYH